MCFFYEKVGDYKVSLVATRVCRSTVNCEKTRKGDCMMKTIVEEKLVSFKELEQKFLNMSVN